MTAIQIFEQCLCQMGRARTAVGGDSRRQKPASLKTGRVHRSTLADIDADTGSGCQRYDHANGCGWGGPAPGIARIKGMGGGEKQRGCVGKVGLWTGWAGVPRKKALGYLPKAFLYNGRKERIRIFRPAYGKSHKLTGTRLSKQGRFRRGSVRSRRTGLPWGPWSFPGRPCRRT